MSDIRSRPEAADPTTSDLKAVTFQAKVRSRAPVIVVVTPEEVRIKPFLFEAVAAINPPYETRFYSIAAGFTDLSGKLIMGDRGQGDISEAFAAIKENRSRCVWVMLDLLPWLKEPYLINQRALRDLIEFLPKQDVKRAQTIVIVTANPDIPPEIATDVQVINWPMPDRIEMGRILDDACDPIFATERTERDGFTPEQVKDWKKTQASVRASITGEEREVAIGAAIGLSGLEAQSCFASSLVMTEPARIDPVLITAEKKEALARSGLESFDPLPDGLDAVGGLENVKEWWLGESLAYTPEGRRFGLTTPRALLLMGIPGCLAEGTRIPYRRGKRVAAGDRSLPIEVLYEKFNGLGTHPGAQWHPGLPTYTQSWDAETGMLCFNEIVAVTDSGFKECIRIVTDGAGIVELTSDHRLLCDDGLFREAGELVAGTHKLLVRGSMKPVPSGRKRVYRKRTVVEGLKHHPVAWRKIVHEGDKTYEYGRITKARLVVEAVINKLDLDDYIHILKHDPERAETLFFLPAEYDVHHIDEDTHNDSFDNLMVVTHAEHAAHHGLVGNFNVEHTKAASISQIDYVGVRRTFDITMTEPHPNFVVNDGIIAHNCGKTHIARAIGTARNCPTVKFDLGGQKSKFVGESEANLRNSLDRIDAQGEIVVLVDEVEKALAGAAGESGDGGVSADALGYLLQWLQDHTSEAFVIFTANDVSKLPPELMRKGRVDEIFWVDVPNLAERPAVLAAKIRDRQRNGTVKFDVDLDEVAEATDQFTGAEIAGLVPSAMRLAFVDGQRTVSTDDLLLVAKDVKPLAVTQRVKLDALRDEWAGRTKPASKADATPVRVRSSARQLDI